VERVDPVADAPERAALDEWLDFHRATVRVKCAGLTDEAGTRHPVPTSPLLSPAGLVSHLIDTEQWWFEAVLHDGPDLSRWSPEDPDRDWIPPDGVGLARLLDTYDERCARSRELAAGLDLSFTARREVEQGAGRPVTLRWIVLHMIEETARHNGHLDVVRELIDGVRGE
jgi:uncharacterized damage-inducible protein DinB